MRKTRIFTIALFAAALALSGCAHKTIVTQPPAKRPVSATKKKPPKKVVAKPAPTPKKEESTLPLKAVEPGLLYIQVGAFSDHHSAQEVRDALIAMGYKGSRMAKDPDDGYYRVQAGVFPDKECAQRALKKLMKKHPESFILSGK